MLVVYDTGVDWAKALRVLVPHNDGGLIHALLEGLIDSQVSRLPIVVEVLLKIACLLLGLIY